MKILGLIPARGGSKGIPRKNIKKLGGKPLIAYTINQAISSSLLSKVIVSTEDLEIASIAKSYGVEVPFIRPQKLASDTASSVDVVRHALSFFDKKGLFFDACMILQVTSPYRPKFVIDNAIKKYELEIPDSLISVREVPNHYNPNWVFRMKKDNKLAFFKGNGKVISRRQDLPLYFHRDGAIYISSRDTIFNKNSLLGDDIIPFKIKSPKLINIDTLDDWTLAERWIVNLDEDR